PPKPLNARPVVRGLVTGTERGNTVSRIEHVGSTWRLVLPERGVRNWWEVAVPLPEPDMYAGEVLREALEKHGVLLKGRVRRADPGAKFDSWPLIGQRDTPMLDVADNVGRRSQGWYAECLFRQVGKAHGAGSFEGAARAVTSYAEKCGASREELE